jgi:hypothetical protein
MRGRGGRKSAASLAVVNVLGNERPAPPDELTEFQREVWQRAVASKASTFFKAAALQVARQRAISVSATTHQLHTPRASPGHPRPPGGRLKVFGRPYRDRASSHNLALTGIFRDGTQS